MDACDKAAVFYSGHALALKGLPPLEVEAVKANFENEHLAVFNEKNALQQWIQDGIKNADKPVCLLLMSSGTFDGMGFEF
jgi:UDP-N-acetylmuramate: L-alanyl-gamma-D-glutamyl-meso-diaminopimelate ligase